jgi:Resolvase, N terminal domain
VPHNRLDPDSPPRCISMIRFEIASPRPTTNVASGAPLVRCQLLASEFYEALKRELRATSESGGRLLVTMLAGIAEFERELILARTSDGRTRAKARGVQFGRPPVLTAHQRQEATRSNSAQFMYPIASLQRLADGHAQADIAHSFNVSQATISRLGGSPFGEAGANVAAS